MAMEEIDFGGKTYISSKRAAKMAGYTNDYVGQLCREGRVNCRRVGRDWYVREDSIMEHKEKKDKKGKGKKEEKKDQSAKSEKVGLVDKMGKLYYKKDVGEKIPPVVKKKESKDSKNITEKNKDSHRVKLKKSDKALLGKAGRMGSRTLQRAYRDNLKEPNSNKRSQKKGAKALKGFIIFLILAALVLLAAILGGGVIKSNIEYNGGQIKSGVSL